MNLGKLEKVDLREIWDTEAGDFTPWLASFFFVDENALAACFESDISEDMVKELAARKPLRVVFRDSGFADDSVKINVE